MAEVVVELVVVNRDYGIGGVFGDGGDIVAIGDMLHRGPVGRLGCAVALLVARVGHCLRPNGNARSRFCSDGLELQNARAYLGLSIV